MDAKLKFAETPLLKIAYEERGTSGGPPVILLHGWPDDIRTWDAIVPRLVEAGFRTIAPFTRGFGPTTFLRPSTIRSGQLSAVGSDVIDFATALGLERYAVLGHDWGARAAYQAASQAAHAVTHCIALCVGYATNHPDQQLSLVQARNYWYHWYMALPRGKEWVEKHRREFCRYLWATWSPTWDFSDAEFDATARSFENPDWAAIVINSYRHRWGLAEGDPRYDALEQRLNPAPVIKVPTLVLHGEIDGANHPETSAGKERFFSGRYARKVLPGVGHFAQREAPQTVASEAIAWLRSQ